MLNETTKILPVDELDIKGIQSWLEEMAQQGFYLDDTIGTWWHFNGGEAKTVRYRIDPCGKNTGKINPEKKQVFEDMGWHYVVTEGGIHSLRIITRFIRTDWWTVGRRIVSLHT